MTRRDLWVAPREDGGILIDPPPDRVEELLETNRRRLQNSSVQLLGRPLSEIRAANFNRRNIACGHQPELFHPGVWLKDFALNGIARRHGALPLRVTIDTDTMKTSAIRLPVWDANPGRVHAETASFDDWFGESPYDTRMVINAERYSEFPEATRPIWGEWAFRPLLPKFWQEATRVDANRPGAVLHGLSLARMTIEAEWGCTNFSTVLSAHHDGSFVGHILGDLPRFHAVYNESVQAYRRRNGLRGKMHPVPDLGRDGEFLEAPFWWRDRVTHRRHRLFAATRGMNLVLRRDLDGPRIEVPRGQPVNAADAPIAIHTRALTTTMFLRLCMTDLFIHGIGGAKYDEVTDDIIRRYFGIEPPEYMVVSGTLRLPFPTFPATPAERRRLARKARDLRWRPEQFLDHENDLVEQKRRWLEREPMTADERRARYRELLHLTEALRPAVADQIAAVEAQLARCDQELAANEILTRRDYPFVLYPESKLRPFLTQLL